MCRRAFGVRASPACVALALLTGCHYLFPYQPGPANDGPRVDRVLDIAWRQEPGRPDAREDTCRWRITDSFDAQLDQSKVGLCTGAPPSSVTVSGGGLHLAPLPDQTPDCYLVYHPLGRTTVRDLSGGALQVRVPQTVTQEYGVEMGVTISDGKWEVNVAEGAGVITFRSWDGQTREPKPNQLPFDPDVHGYWRIQHSPPSTVTWQTHDGKSWVTRRQMADCPLNFGAVEVFLWTGTFRSVAAPGEAVFDDLDVSAGGCL